MKSMKTIRRLSLLLALAACASAPLAPEPAPVASTPTRLIPIEEWHVVLSPVMMRGILAARPEKTITLPQPEVVAPGVPILRGKPAKLAAVPALDPFKVQVYVIKELRRLFGDLPVKVFIHERLPPEHARKRLVLVGGTWAKRPGVLGIADGIDPLNRTHEHILRIFLGSLIETMREDPDRNGAVVPTAREVGTALGCLIAHEMGHSMGLRHHVMEAQTDLETVMVQGVDKYARRYLGKTRWHYVHKIYLYCVLNHIELPAWIVPKYDHEEGDVRCGCEH